ncbi:MAG: methionine--tRNA ligase [Gammaproteobacteria bacterium]|nr:methionine--tRNA ligase [Gammaproteobacteria bacterium]
MKNRRILVTSALPNANGPIHLGHLVEHIQTDIWVRFQKILGNHCVYVCADDAHGTATMLRAEELGTVPEKLIEKVRDEHSKDFRAFHIEHDNYYSTHSIENESLASFFFRRLSDADQIRTEAVRQFFDPKEKMFLADRYIIGSCPRCKEKNQYGDNCESCGATYEATDLIDPISKISGEKPTLKESEHLFFKLSNFTEFLKIWTRSGVLSEPIANKLNEWLKEGLKDWDISRDGPYFGFEIPGYPSKYFYVWLDAPIGYIAAFQNFCEKNDLDYQEYWREESECEVHHFIGKDIINFHALFWPAILNCAGYRTPTKIHVHGFLTVNGTKMSKSRGTFITAQEYLDHLDPEFLRYYCASKLNASAEDIDFNLDDFVQKVNSDLVGKFVNIASRCSKFIEKEFNYRLSEIPSNRLHDETIAKEGEIRQFFEKADYAGAIREIMSLASKANQFIDKKKPWVLIKEETNRAEVQQICSIGLDIFRILTIFLKPILPNLAESAEAFLGTDSQTWSDIGEPIHDKTINQFHPLLKRIDSKTANKIVRESEDKIETKEPRTKKSISIDDFTKIDLRVARVIGATEVEGADKLLKLDLDAGNETRSVFSGIKSAYRPKELKDRLVVLVANLAPRQMKFGVSEGMVLAASDEQGNVYLIEPPPNSFPGMKIS